MDRRINETFSPNEIKSKVKVSLEFLRKYDRCLLQNDVNERSISHKLAIYLQKEFDDWDVDCEYNRDRHEPKRLRDITKIPASIDPENTDAKTVYPDIIVHHRSTNQNLLVIEIKKTTSSESDDFDFCKLKAYREQLYYCYALFLKLRTGSRDVGVEREVWLPEEDID